MKTFDISLNPSELRQAAEELRAYADDFKTKVKMFFDACADHGIMIATMHEGDFAGEIVYSKKFEEQGGEFCVYIVATDTPIRRAWYTSAKGGKMKEAYIRPLLMAEFGSGFKALSDIPAGVNAGQGTLNTYGHAFQENGWTWWSSDASDQEGASMINSKEGRWLFRSYGTPPSRPLHHAVQSLIRDVEGIALSIFH